MTVTRQVGRPHVHLWTSTGAHYDLSGDVVNFNASKPLDAPAGTWSVTLQPRQGEVPTADVRRLAALYQAVSPNDVVSLGFDRPGGIMVGLVDAIEKSRDTSGPQVAQQLTIRGRDLGKMFVQDDLMHASVTVDTMPEFRRKVAAALGDTHPMLIDLQATWGPESHDGTPTSIGAGITELMDFLIDHAGSIELPALAAATGTSGKLKDVIGTALSITSWDEDTIYSDRPVFYQGSLWGFLWSVLDRDFYEARVDCKPSSFAGYPVPTVHLVIRPKPFDEAGANFAPTKGAAPGIGWDDLRTFTTGASYHEIPEHKILAVSLGVSDGEARSVYILTADHDLMGNPGSMAEGLYYPLVDTFSARRFGVKAMQSTISLVSGDFADKASRDEADIGLVSEEVRSKRNRLFNWYRPLPWFENGSVRTPGSDDYRPGDRVFLPDEYAKHSNDKGIHAYCAGVSWDWTFGGMYASTLALQRGHNSGTLDALREAVSEDAPAENPSHYAET